MRSFFPVNGYIGSKNQGNEDGVALLLTVFIIALATILITELSHTSRFDLRASRGFVESIQANFALKSGLNFGKTLLKVPKEKNIKEDWLGEPWALSEKIPLEPLPEISAEPRLLIVDENSKIDLNAILDQRLPNNQPNNPGSGQQSLYWKTVVSNLFQLIGFQSEQFSPEQFRTLGNTCFDPDDQVAVIDDWLDSDHESYKVAGFQGTGIESSANKEMFFNRPLKTITEALMIPGITLERFTQMAPFTKVSVGFLDNLRKINVNTASIEVLTALGFEGSIVSTIEDKRSHFERITKEDLSTYVQGNPYLKNSTSVTSNTFSIYVRIIMPNSTRWLKAYLQRPDGIGIQRSVILKQVEFY